MRVPVRPSDLPAAPRDSRTVAIYCRPHGAGTRPAPLQVFPAVAGGASRAQRLLACRPAMRLAAVVALSYLVLARVAAAGSRPCGDDVPCDCGDVLVSGRTLGDGDPITQHGCDGDGLVVRLRPGAASTVLDLGDHILVGNHRGVGIRVVGGDGTVTVKGPGAVRAFRTGVDAPTGALAGAADVIAADNDADGFNVAGTGFTITSCEATHNGRDGFALRGLRYRVEGNRATENGRYGFSLAGRDAALGDALGNEATGNHRDGLVVRGRDHDVAHPVATANGAGCIRARLAGGRVRGAVAIGNRGAGVRATAHDVMVSGSEAHDNGRGGIDVRGSRVRDGGGNRAPRCRVGALCR